MPEPTAAPELIYPEGIATPADLLQMLAANGRWEDAQWQDLQHGALIRMARAGDTHWTVREYGY